MSPAVGWLAGHVALHVHMVPVPPKPPQVQVELA
jgi:hypothetical protein